MLLVADKNMEFAVRGLLTRPAALGIRGPDVDTFIHHERDPGCLLRSHDFLRPFTRKYHHAIVVFDRDGCGRTQGRQVLETEVEGRLSANGWADRAAAVVIEPELEAWVWPPSTALADALRWHGGAAAVATWLGEQGHVETGRPKPESPKAALEAALRTARQPRSSSIYQRLGATVDFGACMDPAFAKLLHTLRRWFR